MGNRPLSQKHHLTHSGPITQQLAGHYSCLLIQKSVQLTATEFTFYVWLSVVLSWRDVFSILFNKCIMAEVSFGWFFCRKSLFILKWLCVLNKICFWQILIYDMMYHYWDLEITCHTLCFACGRQEPIQLYNCIHLCWAKINYAQDAVIQCRLILMWFYSIDSI